MFKNFFKIFQKNSLIIKGVEQLLPWYALIDQETIFNKDGSFLALFQLQATDQSHLNQYERENILEKVNQATQLLDHRFSIYLDVSRVLIQSLDYTQYFHEAQHAAKAIDQERQEQFFAFQDYYQSNFVLGLCYHPTQASKKKLQDWLFDTKSLGSLEKSEAKPHTNQSSGNISQDLLFFKKQIKQFADFLQYTFDLRLLTHHANPSTQYFNSNACDHLFFALTGQHQSIQIMAPAIDLHVQLSQEELTTGAISQIGENYIQVVAIDQFPEYAYLGILNALNSLNIPFRWSTRFVFCDDDQVETLLENIEKSWDQKTYTYRDMIMQKLGMQAGRANRDAINMSEDANQALNTARENTVRYGYYTSVIVLMHPNIDVVQKYAQFVRDVIQNIHQFNARIENINSEEAFLGSLMGARHYNIRRSLMHTLNLACLLQTGSVYQGELTSPNPYLPTHSPPLAYAKVNGANAYYLNLYEKDVGHTMIVGPTGGGKSTLLAFLLSQFLRYPNAQIFAFDQGRSLEKICRANHGQHYHLLKQDIKLAPLYHLKNEDLPWAANYIEQLITLQGVTPSASQKDLILKTLKLLAHSQYQSLSAFIHLLGDIDMGMALKNYSDEGALNGLLDGDQQDLSFQNFNVFELEDLLKTGEKNIIATLSFLFANIEKRLDGRPTVIALEEVWLVMMRHFFKAQFTQWLVTLRKKNCSVWFTCQNLAQLYEDLNTLSAVIDSTATKIFLPNPNARQRGTSDRPAAFELYSLFGLNEFEIENMIAKANPKQDYYIKQKAGANLIQFDFSETVLAFCGK
jgi:type IV secretion system protein TrbE